MRMMAAWCFDTVLNMSGSSRPAEMSLMMCAPAWRAAFATIAEVVSILMMVSGFCFRIFSRTGMMRVICFCGGTGFAPGREDSPPRSRRLAPWSRHFSAKSVADVVVLWRPPSEKESGVMLMIAMICGVFRGRVRWWASCQVVGGVVVMVGREENASPQAARGLGWNVCQGMGGGGRRSFWVIGSGTFSSWIAFSMR